MHVVAERRHRVNGFDYIASKVARVRGGKAHAPDAGNFAYSRQQFSEGPLPCRILVGIHVLTQQLNFRVAEIGHLTSLGEN